MFNFVVINYDKRSPNCPGPDTVYAVLDSKENVYLVTEDKDKAFACKDKLEAKQYGRSED